MKPTTILFLRRDDQILLAMKKRGFGIGKWNGAGGKVEPGESIEEAAVRECEEELGATPLHLKQIGYLQFFMPDKPGFEHQCHIFEARTWRGEPIESEEMRPRWFNLDKIPFDEMWPVDRMWMPHFLAGELFESYALGTETELLEYELRLVKIIKGGDARARFKAK